MEDVLPSSPDVGFPSSLQNPGGGGGGTVLPGDKSLEDVFAKHWKGTAHFLLCQMVKSSLAPRTQAGKGWFCPGLGPPGPQPTASGFHQSSSTEDGVSERLSLNF